MKFEYKVESIHKITLDTHSGQRDYLNREGKDGWELVSVIARYMDHLDFYFKREIK